MSFYTSVSAVGVFRGGCATLWGTKPGGLSRQRNTYGRHGSNRPDVVSPNFLGIFILLCEVIPYLVFVLHFRCSAFNISGSQALSPILVSESCWRRRRASVVCSTIGGRLVLVIIRIPATPLILFLQRVMGKIQHINGVYIFFLDTESTEIDWETISHNWIDERSWLAQRVILPLFSYISSEVGQHHAVVCVLLLGTSCLKPVSGCINFGIEVGKVKSYYHLIAIGFRSKSTCKFKRAALSFRAT